MTFKIFKCPECRCKAYATVRVLNIHLRRVHPNLPFKIKVVKGKAFKVSNKNHVKPIIVDVTRAHV